ncbi:TPA: DcrB-related protein, partial [Shigella flexneri]|nr:DcrB-related protein [Shigella flexneri]
RVLSRGTALAGTGEAAMTGEQILATHRSGKTEVYQRQAGFITGPAKVLMLTLTTQRPFDDHTDQLWTEWLTSFQPAKS